MQALVLHGAIAVQLFQSIGDLEEETRKIREQLREVPFDLQNDLPIRAAVVSLCDAPRRLILALSHLVADGWAIALLRQEMEALLVDDRSTSPAPIPWHPQDQALWERSAEGLKAMAPSLAYWRSRLERFPRTMFYWRRRVAASPRWWKAHLMSEVVDAAPVVLADRYGVVPSTVLLSAIAIAMSRACCLPFFAACLRVRNRTTFETLQSIGTFHQEAPIIIATDRSTFSQIVETASSEAMTANVRGQCDPLLVENLLQSMDRQRGRLTERGLVVNIVPPARPAAQNVLNMGTSPFRIGWEERIDKDDDDCNVTAFPGNGLLMLMDTSIFSPDEVEQILADVVAILTEALSGIDDMEVIGRRLTQWPQRFTEGTTIDNSPIDLVAVADIAKQVTSAKDASAFTYETTASQPTVKLYIGNGNLQPEALLQAFQAKLSEHRNIIIPKEYAHYRTVPPAGRMEADWLAMVPSAIGSLY